MSQTERKDAESFFSELYHGKHHIPGKISEYGEGWAVNHYGDLSTFDFDTLTRLVFLAHDRCMRVSILQSGPLRVKIAVWKRESRKGHISLIHPTIKQALSEWRKGYESE